MGPGTGDTKANTQEHSQNDYNKGGMITFILSMIASLAIMVYVAFLSGGVDLKEVKPKGAASAVDGAVDPAATAAVIDVSGVKDPWLSTDQMIARGKQVYSVNCAMCHGAEGKGDGVAGASLNPKPRNLVEGKWKKGGTRLGMMDVLQNGIAGGSMQAYKDSIPVNERWALVHFMRSITSNKIADDDAQVAAAAAAVK